jgi:hypothetical protein
VNETDIITPDSVVFGSTNPEGVEMPVVGPEIVHVTVGLPADVHRGLVEAARKSERSLAGQLRFVLRAVVERPELLESQ